jgi:DNA-directed RNA polymerase specialized sigma24 family protein
MDPEDKDLIRRAREGHQPSRAELFRRHADYVTRALYRLAEGVNRTKGGEPILDPREFRAAVEDLARTAFAEAFAQVASFDPTRSSFTTWVVWKGRARLRQVIGSAIKDKIGRAVQVEIETIEELPAHLRATYLPGPWGADPEETAVRGVQQTEYRQKIEAVLRALPEDWARALVLGYVIHGDDFGRAGVTAAALATGRSVDAMDALLRRAKKGFVEGWESRFGPIEW